MKKLLVILTLALALCLLCSVAMAASVEHHQEGVKITYTENAGAPDEITIVPDGSIIFEGNTLTAKKVSKVVAEPASSSWTTSITFKHGEPCVQDGLNFHVLYEDSEHKLYVRAYGIHQIGKYNVWDHEWANKTLKSAATCTAKAVYTYTCEICKLTKDVEEGDFAPHNYMEHITEKPSCTEDGKAILKCSVCGHEDGNEYIAKAGGHSFELHITAPKCNPDTKKVEKGEAYVQCSKCGMYVKLDGGKLTKWEKFGDKVEEAYVIATKEIEKDIDEDRYHVLTDDWSYTAHDWTGWHEIDNTCEAAGYRIRYCNRCGFDQTAAYPDPDDYRNYPCSPEWEVVVLNENGYHCTAELGKDFVIKCALCGGKTNGHMFDAIGTAKNAPDPAGDTYTVAKEFADAVSNKYIRLTFNITGGTSKYGWIGNTHLDHILTHVYLEDAKYLLKDKTDATKKYYTEERPLCEKNTYKYYRCINDAGVVNYQDATHPTYAVVDKPMTGHKWGEWKMMEAPEPEKNAPGRWVRTCTNQYCLDYIGDKHAQEEIKTFDYPCKTEADHAWVKDVVITSATCTTDGLKGEVCSKCNKVKDGSEVVIPAAHTWGEAKELTAATCTEKGVAIKTCTVCGAIEKAEIAAKGHTPKDVDEVPATCKTEGKKAGKVCSVCGVELEGFETIPADEKAHVWGEAEPVKAPTCTEVGSEIRTCEVCGKIEKAEVKALGHDWDEGKITKEATKEAKGEKTFTCKRCGATKTEEVEYVITADPKYAVTELAYDGKTVTGKLVHDEDTLVATDINVRVTFFIEGNYYMATIGEVNADGTFAVDGVGPIEYISVVATGSSSVSPEDVKAMGAGEITVK